MYVKVFHLAMKCHFLSPKIGTLELFPWTILFETVKAPVLVFTNQDRIAKIQYRSKSKDILVGRNGRETCCGVGNTIGKPLYIHNPLYIHKLKPRTYKIKCHEENIISRHLNY